jgi:hypothetical protein
MPPKKPRSMTAKERQQRWRDKQRVNIESHESYLQAERERYARRVAEGKRKHVADMSEREARKQRRKWKRDAKAWRARQKTSGGSLVTPPQSPYPDAAVVEPDAAARQKKGRKKVRRDRAKAYRTIDKLTVKLQHEQLSRKRVQKRYERACAKLSKEPATPRSASNNLLRSGNLKSVRKGLTFSFALARGIKEQYSKLTNQREKQLARRMFHSAYLKKYRMLKHFAANSGISRSLAFGDRASIERKRRRDRHSDETLNAIREFLLRDDNSMMRPGKKECKTQQKNEMQKRFLLDSMLNLHHKFRFENPGTRVSYQFFCRQRPFWVVKPNLKDRSMCLCRTHENVQLMADRLYKLKITDEKDAEKLLETICCSTNNNDCMYRDCNVCKDERINYQPYEQTDTTWWEEWVLQDHEYHNKTTGKTEVTKRTVKIRVEGTVDTLADKFEQALNGKLSRHVYNIRHQYKELRQKRLALAANEAMLHIDFSENYGLKYNREIQSAHFGASNAQVTLHTGMVYTKNAKYGFASISECRRHDAPAIWAHMKPVLDDLSKDRPEMDTLYFVSDGPTTQYRCKTNFYLMSTLPFEWGYKVVNWSFLEAGHGKGAADGIGGSLKRTADGIVASGKDLTDAQSVFTCLSKNTTTRLFLVTEEDVAPMDQYLQPILLKPIRGTMAFHQLVSVHKNQLNCRRLSCFCKGGELCDCFNPINHKFPERPVEPTVPCEDGIPSRSVTETASSSAPQQSAVNAPDDVPQKQSAASKQVPEQAQDVQEQEDDALSRPMNEVHASAPDVQDSSTGELDGRDTRSDKLPDDAPSRENYETSTSGGDFPNTIGGSSAPTTKSRTVIETNPDGRCFFRSLAVGMSQNSHLQTAERNVDGLCTSLVPRTYEESQADTLRAKTVGYMRENISTYMDIDSARVNADLPSGLRYDSIHDRIAAMADPTTMVGEIEIVAASHCLQRPIRIQSEHQFLNYGEQYHGAPLEVRYTKEKDDCGHYDCIINNGHGKDCSEPEGSSAQTPNTKRFVGPGDAVKPKPQKSKKRVKKATRKAKVVDAANWHCLICDEDRVDDMVQCTRCKNWVHTKCADDGGNPNYKCDFCL